MNSDPVLEHFQGTEALLDGHFLLSSGLHSDKYLQCALALQFPSDAARFGRAIARGFLDLSISEEEESSGRAIVDDANVSTSGSPFVFDTVASPAIGGLVIGYATAEALNVRFIWTERAEGQMTLRRGFTIRPGERVLVVEDVITTGGSTRECIAALEANGARVTAAASIIDRSNGTADVGVPRRSLATLNVPTFAPEDCPMCADGIPVVKPGSRAISK
ncbi:MAG TPA: orotate phosphoribosyltransferase [Pyrinomonadaceae bacterium]|nr:orotate phosphoribosyltransferase [Pyrinomonadaceae bacterium]